jgi:predicted SAM-dependent methyltransferase
VKRIAKTLLPVCAQHYLKSIIGKRRAQRILAENRRTGQGIRLEIGSGPVSRRNGLITLDLYLEADVCWDLSMPLPFPANSVSLIYSSHLMEHFAYPQLVKLLENCLRVLKPGGVYSACVPDASTYIRAYSQSNALDSSYLAHGPAVVSAKKMDVINYIAYMDGQHRYMFDEENLAHVLSVNGFTDVRIRDFDPSLDLLERRQGSIYVAGVKPFAGAIRL